MSNTNSPLTLGQLIDGICDYNYVSFVDATRQHIKVEVHANRPDEIDAIAYRIHNRFLNIDAYHIFKDYVIFTYFLE